MTLLNILLKALELYEMSIVVYVFLSWFPSVQRSVFGVAIARLVEPYLLPFRRVIPMLGGVLDLSPLVALVVLQMAQYGLQVLVLKFFG